MAAAKPPPMFNMGERRKATPQSALLDRVDVTAEALARALRTKIERLHKPTDQRIVVTLTFCGTPRPCGYGGRSTLARAETPRIAPNDWRMMRPNREGRP